MRPFGWQDACARNRPALTDWVERRAEGSATAAAFVHLERCRRCEQEISEIAQTVIALRRLGARASAVEPPVDGWRDLRTRLEASRPPVRAAGRRWALSGAMLGPAVVAVLALRIAVSPIIPTTEPALHDGAAWTLVRPMYDSGSQRLTEDIVLVLARRGQAGDGRPAAPVIVPSSTDRRDLRAPARAPVTPSQPTLSRAAMRS